VQRTEKGPVARSATPQASAGGPPEAVCGGHFPSVFRRAPAAPWLLAVSSERLCAPPARCRGWQRGRRVQRRAGAPPISARPQRAAQGWSPAGGDPVGPPEALWADTVMPPFPAGLVSGPRTTARSRRRALGHTRAGPPRSRPPLQSHAGEARPVAWEGRSSGRATAMQGLAVGLRAPSGSRLLGHHVPTLRRSVSVRPLFVLTPLLLVARRSSPLESRDSSMYVQSIVLKKCI